MSNEHPIFTPILESIFPAKKMQYNVCKTCGAKDGRAGILINDECENCHNTRKKGEITIYACLSRTAEEIKKTFSILDK